MYHLLYRATNFYKWSRFFGQLSINPQSAVCTVTEHVLVAAENIFSDIDGQHPPPLGFSIAVARIFSGVHFFHGHMRYTVWPEKRDQNVFGNISDKTRAILMKFDTRFSE